MLHELTPLIGAASRSAVALVLGLLLSRNAAAAPPTVPECLAASEASLQSGNERKRLAERDQLLVCAQPSCPKLVRDECERRLEGVNQIIATVVFDVRDAEGRPLSAVTVLVDGRVLGERVSDQPVPVDPGERHFVFRVAGQAEFARSLTIREAERDRQIQIRLGEKPEDRSKAQAPSPAKGSSLQQTLALVSAGLTVVGLGAGTAFGVRAWSQRNDARDSCPSSCADQAGVDAWTDARRSGNFATASFVVAGVAGAAAAALWLTLPSSTSTRVGLGAGTARITGAF